MRKIFSVTIFASLLFLVIFNFTGCSSVKFSDETFGYIFSEVFDKKPTAITQEDLAKIQGVHIITYSDTKYATISLDGYYETAENGSTKEELQNFEKTIDLTDYEFSSFDDISKLINLREFNTFYVAIPDYSFLDACVSLDSFTSTNNYLCTDYSFLAKFSGIRELYLENCTVNDISFISQLTSLEKLSLNYCASNDYMLDDISAISNLSRLESLSISNNMIYDLTPLSELGNLKYLNAAYNCIDNVSPISNLTELVYIDLTQNPIRDLSSLTHFNPEKFEIIILDLNTLIKDWSPLDYLGKKVQGKPTPTELAKMAAEQNN